MLPRRVALISSCDHNYFPLLREWIHSIRRAPGSRGMDICVLDSGMTAEQLEQLRPLVDRLATARWPTAIPAKKIRGREYFRACVNRPFLNDYFPDYEYYFWMDADTWVQNWDAVELFLEGAARGKIALTGQADRAYPKGMRVKWLGPWPLKIRSFYFSNARRAFGVGVAKQLYAYHGLLAGAYCLHRDAPHWKVWQRLILQALERGNAFTAEQLALGMMVHLEGLPAEILPSWCHWLGGYGALWDKDHERWVEPYLPHMPIGILHLSGRKEMRMDRSFLVPYRTLQGEAVQMSYRYPWFDGASCTELTTPS